MRMRMSLTCAVIGLAATAAADARSDVQRDVEGYAIATCLSNQNQPYLKDQGDAWASVIVQRGKGELDAFTDVAAAVKKELAKGSMPVARAETEASGDKALPVQYCSEIIDAPGVRTAIQKAVRKLEPSYRRR